MRLIDVDELWEELGILYHHNNGRVTWNDALTEIKTAPTIEPEQIVRCKDCKHQEKFFHEDKRRKEGGYYIFGCELADGYSHVCLDEDFCSQAERKDT